MTEQEFEQCIVFRTTKDPATESVTISARISLVEECCISSWADSPEARCDAMKRLKENLLRTLYEDKRQELYAAADALLYSVLLDCDWPKKTEALFNALRHVAPAWVEKRLVSGEHSEKPS